MSNIIINPYKFVSAIPFPNTYSLDFDGVDGEVLVQDESFFSSLGNFTLSLWFKKDDIATHQRMFSAAFNGANDISIGTNTSDRLYVNVKTGGSGVKYLDNFTASYAALNVWHHIVLVFDGSLAAANRMAIYLDGSPLTMTTYTNPPATTPSQIHFFSIGSYYDRSALASQYFFNGSLDEVGIWTSSLTSADVSTLWNSGTPNDLSTALGSPPDRWYRNGDSGLFFNSNWEIPVQNKLANFSSHSFQFDGTDDYIDLGSTINELKPTGAFSISAWFKIDNTNSPPHKGIIQCGQNTGYLLLVTSNTVKFYIYTTASGWVFATSTITLVAGTYGHWYHVLGTWNGVDTITIYVNGGNSATATVNDILYTGVGTTSHQIGRYINSGNSFEGKISDVAFFDGDKSGDVATFYNGGEPTDLSGESGLVGYWLMDSGSYWNGTNWWIPDYSKNTLFSQKSFNFDGVNDYVSMGNVLDKDGTEAFSISTWVKYTSGGTQMIVSKQDGSGYGFLLHTGVFSGQKIIWYPCIASGGNIQVRNSSAINDGNWHHILATYDGSGDASGAKIYIDGSLDTNIITDTFTGSSSSSGNLQISARNGTSFPFNGSQDDVAIFSSDKSASASSIYNSGVPSNLSAESGLEGYWTFDDATFSTNWSVPDNSSNSNTGTSVNMDEVDLEFNTPTNPNAGLSIAMDLEDGMNSAPDNIHQGKSENMELADKSTDVP